MHIIIHVNSQPDIEILKTEIANTFTNVTMIMDFVDSFVVRVPDMETFNSISQFTGVSSVEETTDVDKIQ